MLLGCLTAQGGSVAAVGSSKVPASLDLYNCSFSDESAVDSGGAIYARLGSGSPKHDDWGALIVIRGCTFTRCAAGSLGGAAFFDTGATAAILSSIFVSNLANESGGAIAAARTLDPDFFGYSPSMLLEPGTGQYSNRWWTFGFIQSLGWISADMAAALRHAARMATYVPIAAAVLADSCTFNESHAEISGEQHVNGRQQPALWFRKCVITMWGILVCVFFNSRFLAVALSACRWCSFRARYRFGHHDCKFRISWQRCDRQGLRTSCGRCDLFPSFSKMR